MKFLGFMFSMLLIASACDRPLVRPKGSDIEWQQRQEQQQEQERFEEKQLKLDERQEKELEDREVKADKRHQDIQDINFNPANQ